VPQRGKRYIKAREGINSVTQYSVDDALEKVLAGAMTKFDESVDVAVRLGVNPRKADQMVRGACSLPHGTGKTVRVAVFADGDAAKAAEAAGADIVGGDELVKKIQEGWTDFDKAIAVRSMMAKVGRIGRILGPRGLMPNPKTGTVVAPDKVAEVVRAVKGGRVDFRVESGNRSLSGWEIQHVSRASSRKLASTNGCDFTAQAIFVKRNLCPKCFDQQHDGSRGSNRLRRTCSSGWKAELR
jgi:large subunit ribosomal protein L1